MIVFDLVCHPAGHVFEAWFAYSSAFESQKVQGLLLCPICGSQEVGKAVMAPHVGAKSNQRAEAPASRSLDRGDGTTSVPAVTLPTDGVATGDGPSLAAVKSALAALARAQAQALANAQWVGRDFSRQARAMDAGEMEQAGIYGEASLPEVKALIDDGIEVMPLPLPVIPPNQSN